MTESPTYRRVLAALTVAAREVAQQHFRGEDRRSITNHTTRTGDHEITVVIRPVDIPDTLRRYDGLLGGV